MYEKIYNLIVEGVLSGASRAYLKLKRGSKKTENLNDLVSVAKANKAKRAIPRSPRRTVEREDRKFKDREKRRDGDWSSFGDFKD